MRCIQLFYLFVFSVALVSCGDDEHPDSSPPSSTRSETDENAIASEAQADVKAVPGRSEYDPVSPEIKPLPAHIAFDPCSLLSNEFAQSLGIPIDQRIERIGGTRKIPEDHRYTPYVGCIWRNVVQGVPRVAVEVQLAAENLEVNGDPLSGLGDAAWFGERRGRGELRMHLDEYVIFIRAELPHNPLNSQQAHEAIARHLVGVLDAPPSGLAIPQDASLYGGPSVNICEAARDSGLADLLPGPKAWAFPSGAINHVPDEQNAKPDADYVGCTFAGTTRGSVQVRFLGPHGIKRQFRLYSNQVPVTINGTEGFRKRNGLYLPFGEGAFELTETMSPYDDERLPQKLETIMQNIVETVSQ